MFIIKLLRLQEVKNQVSAVCALTFRNAFIKVWKLIGGNYRNLTERFSEVCYARRTQKAYV